MGVLGGILYVVIIWNSKTLIHSQNIHITVVYYTPYTIVQSPEPLYSSHEGSRGFITVIIMTIITMITLITLITLVTLILVSTLSLRNLIVLFVVAFFGFSGRDPSTVM